MSKFLYYLNIFFSSPRRITIGLGVLKFFRAFLSLLSITLSARYFGTSLERDAWVLGGSFVSICINLLFGPLNEIFRAKFIHIKAEFGKELAVKSINSLFYFVFILSFFVILYTEIYPNFLSNILAPGYNLEQKRVLNLMFRLVTPGLLLIELVTLLTSILNAYESFYLPDIFGFFSVLFNILCIIILAPLIGIYSLIISTYISTFLLLIFLFKKILKTDSTIFSLIKPQLNLIKPYILFSLPFYFSYVFGQIQSYCERSLATIIGVGSVSALDYARRFVEMPMNIIFSIVPSVLTPYLAQYVMECRWKDFYENIVKFLRMFLIIIFPISVIFITCPTEFILIMLKSGNFSAKDVLLTSNLLQWFGIGLIGIVFYIIAGQALVAKKHAQGFVLIGVIITIFSIVVNYLLYKKMGIVTFSISWSLGQLISGLILFIYLTRKTKKSSMTDFKNVLLLLLFITVVTVCTFFIKKIIFYHIDLNTVSKLYVFGIMFTVLLLAVFLLLFIVIFFNLEEKKYLILFRTKMRFLIKKNYEA